jgi:hypothetical protein
LEIYSYLNSKKKTYSVPDYGFQMLKKLSEEKKKDKTNIPKAKKDNKKL